MRHRLSSLQMGPDMIKPFKILETRTEADGAVGVIYEVSRTVRTGPGKTSTTSMRAYMQIPDGKDADQYLFEELSKVGWF